MMTDLNLNLGPGNGGNNMSFAQIRDMDMATLWLLLCEVTGTLGAAAFLQRPLWFRSVKPSALGKPLEALEEFALFSGRILCYNRPQNGFVGGTGV